MKRYTIAIHGGAGTILRSSMTSEQEAQYHEQLRLAVEAGEAVLAADGPALDAVQAAVVMLEDCPLFNAGKGAVFNNNGQHELDAAIMDGSTLKAGGVASVRNIKNPVRLARAVMDESEYVLLGGAGAMDFARLVKAEMADDAYFFQEARFKQLELAKLSDGVELDHNGERAADTKFGTVGAVALDTYGNVAAATSTGGMTNKKFGRIGDSPVIGAGTYANNTTCAISCTGHGEYFLRAVAAYDVSCLMEYKGLSLQDACRLVVHDKLVKFGGRGGLIAVDNLGNIELAFNSEGMFRAMKKSGGKIFTAIYKD